MLLKYNRIKMVSEVIPSFIQKVKYKHHIHNDYEESVKYLNNLALNISATSNQINSNRPPKSIDLTKKYLSRVGITMEQLDKLSVIHVAGTKGKGSVCALCESILRHHGYKTGFFSSPHLIAVRERIRINGLLLSPDVFTRHFYEIYNKLFMNKEHENDMPGYFHFLTLMCFNVFIAEKVDVAILEVGIGGEHDCTNIVRNTAVGGITSLGFDHEAILGYTMESIAWNKSGIMKKGSKVFSVQQPSDAMIVLHNRSVERQCSLSFAPEFQDYKFDEENFTLGLNGDIQKINASLAIQISNYWLENFGSSRNLLINNLNVPNETKMGLKNCKWPGRYQILRLLNATVYLDGAHTLESIDLCIEWYRKAIDKSKDSNKILVFNRTGKRNPEPMLKKLQSFDFDGVYFVPNVCADITLADQPSQINENVLENCEQHKNIWMNLLELQMKKPKVQTVNVMANIEDVFGNFTANKHSEVLVTGSLHLIGATLTLLDPDLKTF